MVNRWLVLLCSLVLFVAGVHAQQTSKETIEDYIQKSTSVVDTNFSLALQYINKAMEETYLHGFDDLHLKSLNTYHLILVRNAFFQEAFELHPRIDSMMQLVDSEGLKIESLTFMAELYSRTKNSKKAKELCLNALSLAKKKNNTTTLGHLYLELGINTMSMQDYKEAGTYFQKSKELFASVKDTHNLIVAENNIATWLNGMERFDEALEKFKEVEAAKRKAGNTRSLVYTLANKAVTLTNLERYKEASSVVTEAQELLMEGNYLLEKISVLEVAKLLHLKQNDYQKAYDYQKKAQQLKDSLWNEEKERRLQHLQQFFELKAKDQQILNQEKDLAITKLELSKRNLEKQTLLVLLSVSLVGLLILIYAIVTIKKVNKKLKESEFTLKENNVLLEKQKQELSHLSELKSTTFSILAHDLRQPLATFKTITELLDMKGFSLPEKEDKVLRKTLSSTIQLIDNLLIWSTTEAGKISWQMQTVHPAVVVDNVMDALSTESTLQQALLVNRVPLELSLSTDPSILEHIFKNLIVNAINHTERKTLIEINGYENNDSFTFSVEDNGKGMDEEKLTLLFNSKLPKTQAKDGDYKGAGLGLYLCKQYMDILNGSIYAENKAEGGLRVSFVFRKH